MIQLWEGFRKKIKKKCGIFHTFSIPVSQMCVVCVVTLGYLNTGYKDIHVETSLNFNKIWVSFFGTFHPYRHIENTNQKPKFFTTILIIINKKVWNGVDPAPRVMENSILPFHTFYFWNLPWACRQSVPARLSGSDSFCSEEKIL